MFYLSPAFKTHGTQTTSNKLKNKIINTGRGRKIEELLRERNRKSEMRNRRKHEGAWKEKGHADGRVEERAGQPTKRRETGGWRAQKQGCEPEKLLLTHSAAHLGCKETHGPFLICYVRFLHSYF